MVDRLVIDSPVGQLRLTADGDALTEVRFLDGPEQVATPPDPAAARVMRETATQLAEYFEGQRRVFELPLRARGTDFQRAVWAALREIPWGTTATYGDIARRLGMPASAARAVGAANGANPLPIVVPCHRVIGADGLLTGFGGGLHRKEILLRLEGVPTERDQLALF